MGIYAGESVEQVLRRMQAEPIGDLRAREATTFDSLAGEDSNRIVLFGAGPLGRSVVAGLRSCGVEPLAFADNNPHLWGQNVQGLTVLSPTDAASRYGESAVFVVTIYNGSAVRRQLAQIGCRHVAAFASLFWKFSKDFIPGCGLELPERIRSEAEAIRACESILEDEPSRRELCQQLIWRYWLDGEALSPALEPAHIYFPFDLVQPLAAEVFVDCGSFDGDTITSFVNHWNGSFCHAYAFEPDPANRTRLCTNLDSLGIARSVTVKPFAVGNQNGRISFVCTSSAGSHIAAQGEEGEIECRRLDDLEWPFVPTYIKMDVEGAEIEALRGAAGLLRQHLPVLAICTYHRSNHLWEIPRLIKSISSEYAVFLRRYAEDCWEEVCYGIPKDRLRSR